MEPVIEVKNLKKFYGKREVLKDISFELKKGEVLGFLGPNGAGKTTTLEIILGLVHKNSGDIKILGEEIGENLPDDVKSKIGASFQSSGLYDDLKVSETLKLFADLNNAKNVDFKEIAEETGITELMNLYTKSLSGGQKQRLIFAISIIHNPEIIFLDEPTVGLDPKSRRDMWDLISGLKKKNKSIILTSHYMDEIEKLSNRIIIINKGEIVTSGSIDEIKKNLGKTDQSLEDIMIELEKD